MAIEEGVKYKLEVFQGSDFQFYWRIKHLNGQTLLVSEGYRSKASAVEVSMRFYVSFNERSVEYDILD